MSKLNKKAEDFRFDNENKLAGGFGMSSAKEDSYMALRRCVMANLLWEDVAYQDGESVAERIKQLIPQVDPSAVAQIIIEAKTIQHLRHTPLFMVREMARISTHKHLVSELLYAVIQRADELADFLALYWKDGKCPISKQVKLGLARAFSKFDEYQFSKYNRDNAIKLRDVMFMVHPDPMYTAYTVQQYKKENDTIARRVQEIENRKALYKKIANNELSTPDTWEVALSAGKDKKATWERLIQERKLGALAFLRNLANMEKANVSHEIIKQGFATINSGRLLPVNFLAAQKHAPRWEREIEAMMLRTLSTIEKLPGRSIFVVDVSGSMGSKISTRSEQTRREVASAMALLAREVCEDVVIYATAGSDGRGIHATELVPNRRGFGLIAALNDSTERLGGGGIFTRQCLEYIKSKEQKTPDRIMIFSDSQDCDRVNKAPQPFGKNNYIVDVSANTHGINYKGVWTAEISGWSQHFLTYIAALEGINFGFEQSEEENG